MGIPLMQNARADPNGMYVYILRMSASCINSASLSMTRLGWHEPIVLEVRHQKLWLFCKILQLATAHGVRCLLDSVSQRNSGHDCLEGPGCWDVAWVFCSKSLDSPWDGEIHRIRHHGTPWMSQSKPCGFEIGAIWVCLKMLCTPIYPMVLLIIIPTKWLVHWGYTLFSDKPISGISMYIPLRSHVQYWSLAIIFKHHRPIKRGNGTSTMEDFQTTLW